MMNFLKKSFCFLLILTLALSLFGCSESEPKAEGHILRETSDGITLTYDVDKKTLTLSGEGPFTWSHDLFYNYTLRNDSLTTLIVEEGITAVNFINDFDALKTVSLPSTLTEIKNSFDFCSALEQITIPENVTLISGSFYNCTALNNLVFPEKVEQIVQSFDFCPALSSISFKGAPLIDAAFHSCDALQELAIPANSTLCSAFNDCSALKTIRLGANVSCHDIESKECGESFVGRKVEQRTVYAAEPLHMDAATAITAGIDELNIGYAKTKLIPVPKEEGGDPEKVAIPPTRFSFEFDEQSGILTVSGKGRLSEFYPCTLKESHEWGCYPELFEENHTVKKLIIGEGITHVYNCFNDMVMLEEVTLPESLQSATYSFIGCTKLKELTIPKNLKNIHGFSFDQCVALEKLTLQGAIDTCYFGGAFNGLESLKEVNLPAGSTLCNSFKGCSRLEKVTLNACTLHEFESDDDDSVCRPNFKDAKKHCTFYVDQEVYRSITHPNYAGPIENAEQYKFIVTDGETFTNEKIFNNEQHQLFIPGS